MPASFRSTCAVLLTLAFAFACGGLSEAPTPDPQLPAARLSAPDIESHIANNVAKQQPETEVLEVRLTSKDDAGAKGVIYKRSADGHCRSQGFSAAVSEGAWTVKAGKEKIRSCPKSATSRGTGVNSAMDAVHEYIPPDYKAKKRDALLENAICQSFNLIGWQETFFGASIYHDWQTKHSNGTVVARTAPAWLFSVNPDGSCRRQDFTITQPVLYGGEFGIPARLSTGGHNDLPCPPPHVVVNGVDACTWTPPVPSAFHASLHPKVPRPLMRDSALETALVDNYNSIGWQENFLGAVIVSRDFQYIRKRGKVVSRRAGVVMVSQRPQGTCQSQDFTFQQVLDGGTFGTPTHYSTGGQRDIPCP